jgi:radical SAM protein with 4Fe4S-binding SPASM domain
MKFKRINIEISNICNLKCSFCPEVDRNKQVMGVSEFREILSKVAERTEEIVPHLLGEPLNHPHFAQILEEAHKFGAKLNLTTNGVLINDERSKLLLHPAVRQVNFSFQAFEDNFKEQSSIIYLRRIEKFVLAALEHRPDLYINFRFWNLKSSLGELEISDLMSQAAEIFQFSWSDVNVDIRRRKNFKIRGRLYLHFDSRFEWPRLDRPEISDKGFCHALTGHFGIHADGKVVPCCLDDKGVLNLGNLFESSLDDILNSPRAVNIREGFAKGELREELCRKCDFITRFSRKPLTVKKR